MSLHPEAAPHQLEQGGEAAGSRVTEAVTVVGVASPVCPPAPSLLAQGAHHWESFLPGPAAAQGRDAFELSRGPSTEAKPSSFLVLERASHKRADRGILAAFVPL